MVSSQAAIVPGSSQEGKSGKVEWSTAAKMVLPRRADALRADEFEEGLEVAEDRSGTAGVDPLPTKHLSVAIFGHDGPLFKLPKTTFAATGWFQTYRR
jgi:hypothetical protein